jgi:hypothetical protein
VWSEYTPRGAVPAPGRHGLFTRDAIKVRQETCGMIAEMRAFVQGVLGS